MGYFNEKEAESISNAYICVALAYILLHLDTIISWFK